MNFDVNLRINFLSIWRCVSSVDSIVEPIDSIHSHQQLNLEHHVFDWVNDWHRFECNRISLVFHRYPVEFPKRWRWRWGVRWSFKNRLSVLLIVEVYLLLVPLTNVRDWWEQHRDPLTKELTNLASIEYPHEYSTNVWTKRRISLIKYQRRIMCTFFIISSTVEVNFLHRSFDTCFSSIICKSRRCLKFWTKNIFVWIEHRSLRKRRLLEVFHRHVGYRWDHRSVFDEDLR